MLIRPESVNLALGVKLIGSDELLYQVTLIVSPKRKFLTLPITLGSFTHNYYPSDRGTPQDQSLGSRCTRP
jgi:hypothetical protein